MSAVRRTADGKRHPDTLDGDGNYAALTIDDATGVVLTTPTTAAAIKGSPMAVGLVSSAVDENPSQSATNGTITIARPGVYEVGFSAGEIVGVNSQAAIIEVYKNAAVLSPAVLAKVTQPATALAIVSLAASALVSLARGDVLDFRATASTGNFTCKRGHFYARQIRDAV